MAKYIVIALLIVNICGVSEETRGQTVKLLSVDQLELRLDRGKDTTYVVNFWATWCGPCLKEMPHFEKLQAEFADQKLKVLFVSIDNLSKLKSAVVPLAKRLKLKNEVFLLNEKDPQVYLERIDKKWSGALPASIFVNKVRGKREFYEKEFTYAELVKTYQSI
ncbi:MAG: TlpA disulfide reductase family protein [Bacteroidota bacterium]